MLGKSWPTRVGNLWLSAAVLISTANGWTLKGISNPNVLHYNGEKMDTGRRLKAAAAEATPSDGWGLGRVSWTNPSLKYQQQIVNYTSSSGAGVGSCNLYNGQQANASRDTLTVPVAMQAGLAESSPDFAGSCGRCYQLQCVNGPVMGNTTANMHTNYSLADAKPSYLNPTFTNRTFVDDQNRTFPGNAGAAAQVVDVLCWNATSDSVFIQITDSCDWTTPTCATNFDQFNIDYEAFSALAHPGYGLMNVQYRAVNCSNTDVPLSNTSDASLVSTTIIGKSLESGWGLNAWAGQNASGVQIGNAITQELQATVRRHNVTTEAACFTFDLDKANQSAGASVAFECRDCDTTVNPFTLNNTAGISFDIQWAQNNSGSEYDFLRIGFPPLTVGIAERDGTPISMTGFFPDLANNTASGMIPVSLLYQDSQPYSLLGSLSETLTGLETLQKATRVTFAYNATADVDQSAAVSFCIANLQLLPSTVNTTAGFPPIPEGPAAAGPLPNCPFPEPEPVNQADQLIDDGAQLANATDYVTADHVEYTIFEHTDNANQFGIFLASNESCSSSKRISDTTRRTLDTCANNPQKAGPNPQCCYDFGSGTLDAGTVVNIAADICDDILFQNASGAFLCNGFNFNRQTGVAFFKSLPVNQFIPNDSYCNSPAVTTWILKTALSHIWSVAGAVGSIAAAGTAFGLWLLLTNSFRMDRQMVITQVYRNVAESDITSALSSHVEDSMQAARSGSNSALDLARSGSNPDSNPARSGSIPNPLMSSMGYPVDRSFDPLDSSAGLIDNAILGAAVAAAGTMSRGESFGVSDDAKKVAKQITKRCLQRWDAPGGFRASTDSLGRKSGIWRDKFDGVRSATMLLAMRRFNNGLMGGYAGSLMQTWQQSNWKHQAMIITQLCRVLQSISEEEAQSLHPKDPETGGMNDKLCSLCHACGSCCSIKQPLFNFRRLGK